MLNACLTPICYYFAMQTDKQTPLKSRTGNHAGFWLSLAFALALHLLFLLIPVIRQIPVAPSLETSIELQLTGIDPKPVLIEPEPEPEPETFVMAQDEPTATQPVTSEPPPATTSLVARKPQPDLNTMSEPEKSQLTNNILSRQYFTEESAVDQLFGKPLPQQNAESVSEFQYPSRPNMITMLDKPMPEAPFAYTPDLVYFAYDPGVKGDLQRFWDVITPEFGWRTTYGTEFRCKLVLVIIGCGWK